MAVEYVFTEKLDAYELERYREAAARKEALSWLQPTK